METEVGPSSQYCTTDLRIKTEEALFAFTLDFSSDPSEYEFWLRLLLTAIIFRQLFT